MARITGSMASRKILAMGPAALLLLMRAAHLMMRSTRGRRAASKAANAAWALGWARRHWAGTTASSMARGAPCAGGGRLRAGRAGQGGGGVDGGRGEERGGGLDRGGGGAGAAGVGRGRLRPPCPVAEGLGLAAGGIAAAGQVGEPPHLPAGGGDV